MKILFVVPCLLVIFLLTNCSTETEVETEEKVEIIDIRVGTGAEAVFGDSVKVHYVGTLTDGRKFDSSRDRDEPFMFKLGIGDVIKGWDQGVLNMKVGGLRKLIIPPSLGYGNRDHGPIPGKSTLIFEVELLAIKK